MKSDKHSRDPIVLVEFAARTASLLGILGLLLVLAQSFLQSAGAETPPPGGFRPGAKTFSNPFNAPPPPSGGGNTFFDDEEDDELDYPDDAPAPRGGAPSVSRPTNPRPGGAPSSPGDGPGEITNGPRGISVGGQPAGGVNTKNVQAPAECDTESAEGSREIVTDFNFPDADIMDIAKTLGKLTGKNFILDKDVKGRITIISNSPVTVCDAWKAFLTALDMSAFALIPSGKYIRIARQRDARDKQLKTYTGDYSPDTDALITRVFPLKYLTADEVARNFRSFMPANSRIIPYDQTNTVIVTDTGSNIAKLQKLLDILDVEGYDAGIETISVQFASAVELAKLIDTLIPGAPAGPAGAPGGARFGGNRGGFSARRTKEGGVINTIIADERTNTLIVHANSRGADQVRELVTKLDRKQPSASGGGKVHVVYLQFAEAELVAQTLNGLTGGAGAAPRPGGGPGGGTGVNPVQATLFEGTIKVSPDKSTNSLVVTASPGDFVTVQRVINRLDIPRDQVFAEVIIMELLLNRGSEFSANIAFPGSVPPIGFLPQGQDLLDFAVNPFSQRGAVLGFGIGATRNIRIGTVDVPVQSVQGLVKALQTHSNGNVLATPQILALDNTEAIFETSEAIPVPTVTVSANIAQQAFTKENVSLTIKIKPQINKLSPFVKLDIDAKLEDINNRNVPSGISGQAFGKISRSAKTSIVVADKDTVVLGGLTRDASSETVSKVPILGDIPLLGWLFKARTASLDKTNLLIFITPQIIRQYENIRAVLDKKLRERDEFIESSTGGYDVSREYRDKMIRSLPDLKGLNLEKPKNISTIESGPTEKDETVGSISRPKTPTDAPNTANEAAPVAPPAVPGGDAGGPPPPGADALPPPPPASN